MALLPDPFSGYFSGAISWTLFQLHSWYVVIITSPVTQICNILKLSQRWCVIYLIRLRHTELSKMSPARRAKNAGATQNAKLIQE